MKKYYNYELNYGKLLGRIKEKYGARKNLVKKISISSTSLDLRLKNQLNFNQRDIVELCEALDIPPEEIPIYFFTPKVTKT